MPRFSMEAPIANNEKKIDTPEQERPVPPGYDSIPHEMWLNTTVDVLRDDFPEEDFDKQWFMRSGKFLEEKFHCDYYKIIIEPFEKMRRAASKILLETDLSLRIERGDYALLLGEDSSGRIQTLFLKEMVKGLCSENDTKAPATHFYAGLAREVGPPSSEPIEESAQKFLEKRRAMLSRLYAKELSLEEAIEKIAQDRESQKARYEEFEGKKAKWKEEMGEYIENLRKSYLLGTNQAKRILLCTETISSGGSIQNIIEVLNEYGCDFDVFTFAGGTGKKSNYSEKNSTVFSGGLWNDAFDDSTRSNYWMSGIFKKQGDVRARSIREIDEESKGKGEHAVGKLSELMSSQEAMKLSREMATYVGANVAQAYLDYKAGKFELPTEPK